MASPRSKSTTRFYASAMPSGVVEKDWVKQELQRLADTVFAQLDKDKKELTDSIETLSTRLSAIEAIAGSGSLASIAQLRIDIDNVSGQVNTNTSGIAALNSSVATLSAGLASTNANLDSTNAVLLITNTDLDDIILRFNTLTDQT